MCLYTIVPEELIFKQEIEKTELREINYSGAQLLVKLKGDSYEVERVISTDPADFLNNSISPGSIIKMFP